jgi:hypothetical protein
VTSGTGCAARAPVVSLETSWPREALPSSESAATIRPLGSWTSSTGPLASFGLAALGAFDLVDMAMLEVLDPWEASWDWNMARMTGMVWAMINTAASAW